MSIPELIPIQRIEDYYTKNIGSYCSGLFMGFVVAQFDSEMPKPMPKNWDEYKNWYAILYKFSSDGTHVGTDFWLAGKTSDGESKVTANAAKQLQDFILKLGPVKYENIAVKLFQVTIDNNVFGLFEGDDGSVLLLPNDLAFYEPWNGQYDT
ncbi:MAG TPA: hypothetical protein V6C89_18710 [Drouetiella sp.]|jgi:hypothetical protein